MLCVCVWGGQVKILVRGWLFTGVRPSTARGHILGARHCGGEPVYTGPAGVSVHVYSVVLGPEAEPARHDTGHCWPGKRVLHAEVSVYAFIGGRVPAEKCTVMCFSMRGERGRVVLT